MQLKCLFVFIVGGLCIQSASWAGAMGESSSSFAGFWAGVGGSYDYSTINGKTNISKISSTPSTAEYLLNDNLTNHMAPVVNAGYYYDLHNDWLVGAKFLYKYIGQEQFDLTWSGSYTDGTYQSAGLRTKLIQDFYALASGGFQFGNWLVYGGVGPSWTTVRADLNGDFLPAASFVFTPVNTSQSKTILGGAGQLGFQYMLPKQFSVDVSYSFLATPTTNLPAITFGTASGANYALFNQSTNIVEQGINVTLNKFF